MYQCLQLKMDVLMVLVGIYYMLYFLHFSLLNRLYMTASYLFEDNRELTGGRKRYNCDDVFNVMCFTAY